MNKEPEILRGFVVGSDKKRGKTIWTVRVDMPGHDLDQKKFEAHSFKFDTHSKMKKGMEVLFHLGPFGAYAHDVEEIGSTKMVRLQIIQNHDEGPDFFVKIGDWKGFDSQRMSLFAHFEFECTDYIAGLIKQLPENDSQANLILALATMFMKLGAHARGETLNQINALLGNDMFFNLIQKLGSTMITTGYQAEIKVPNCKII